MLVGLLLEHERTVDEEIVKMEVLSFARLVDGITVNAVEPTILHVYVIYGVCQFLVFVANNHHTVFRLLASDVLHVDILDGGVEASAAYLLRLVVGIDFQHSFAALSHFHVAEVDVFDDTAATRVGLDAEHTVQIGRVHLAVLNENVLATA